MIRQGFALFDFDGTMIRGDSILLCIRYAIKTGFASPACLPGIGFAFLAYALRRKSDTQAKERALRFLTGRTAQEVRAFSEAFCKEVLLPRIFPKALEELESARANGLKILMVSASPDFYLMPLKELLNLEGIIATRADVTAEGRYTGRITGFNCRGMEKALRIAEYLAAAGYELDTQASWAYGDSGHDWPMMSLVKYPVAVNAKKTLLRRCAGCRQERWTL